MIHALEDLEIEEDEPALTKAEWQALDLLWMLTMGRPGRFADRRVLAAAMRARGLAEARIRWLAKRGLIVVGSIDRPYPEHWKRKPYERVYICAAVSLTRLGRLEHFQCGLLYRERA